MHLDTGCGDSEGSIQRSQSLKTIFFDATRSDLRYSCLGKLLRTAATLVHELMKARDERRLLRLQKQMVGYKLLIIDVLGFVPLSKTGVELLFELISLRYERGSTLITNNLPFDEWTEPFGSELRAYASVSEARAGIGR